METLYIRMHHFVGSAFISAETGVWWGNTLFSSVFILVVFCIICSAIYVSSVFTSGVAEDQRQSIYGWCIANSILIQRDSILSYWFDLEWPVGLWQ